MKKQNKSTVNSKKCETKASDLTRSVHLHRHDVLTVPLTVLLHCPIRRMMCAQIGLLMTNHIPEFCYSFGWVYNAKAATVRSIYSQFSVPELVIFLLIAICVSKNISA